jgi:hypothetical protein
MQGMEDLAIDELLQWMEMELPRRRLGNVGDGGGGAPVRPSGCRQTNFSGGRQIE